MSNSLLNHVKTSNQTTKQESNTRFHKQLIWINALLPLALLIADIWQNKAGANPIEFALRFLGVMTLIFVLITLAVTPIRRLANLNYLIKYRRLLGLFAFFYAFLHTSVYIIFDKSMNLIEVAKDVIERPFISIGMLAFLLLIPLAITSSNRIRKKMKGKTWLTLHKLSYLIGILGVIHYYLLVRSNIFYPVLFGIILFILLSFRVNFYLKNYKK